MVMLKGSVCRVKNAPLQCFYTVKFDFTDKSKILLSLLLPFRCVNYKN